MDKQILTLNQAWKRSIARWKWITDEFNKKNNDRSITILTTQWSEKIGVRHYCEFCKYALENKLECDHRRCNYCPGRQIDPTFFCMSAEYDFGNKPNAFFAKLTELYAKYKAEKKVRRTKA